MKILISDDESFIIKFTSMRVKSQRKKIFLSSLKELRSDGQMNAAGIPPWQVMTGGQSGEQGGKILMEEKLESCKDVSSTTNGPHCMLLETYCNGAQMEIQGAEECSQQQAGNSFWWQFYADFARGNRRTSAGLNQTPALFRFQSDMILSFIQCLVELLWCLDLHALKVLTAWLPVNDVCSPSHV